ncbi:hypothetical protein O3P69_009291 [Scylla paramamosain]|uniref:Kinesin-like protein n=1 Tax=Scylla paramamosain TaxID=85552 RepID=A0AAW0TAP1_SCYPA
MKENTVDGDELMKTGKLHLVDLAGSENIGRSGAVEKRAREAGNINMSLLTLGRVITALVEKAPHIPYRESKLTRLLQDALGGRTKTSVIATISPASVNQEETLSTLDYAHRAKNIQNKPEEYSQEIERLRRDLLAMREKNGVYLANENYQEMQATMEAQATEITEKIAHIRTLEAEMEKKLQLFAEVRQQLETTSQELADTKERLSDTCNTLSCTQKLLHTTAQEREEQRYLVSAHARTEEKLQVKGQTLIDVASCTSSDLSRLHDKLDRKRNVESQNTQVFQDFQASFTQIQDSLRHTLKSSLTQHTDKLKEATRLHCEGLQECRGAVSRSGRAVGALADTHAALTASALTLQEEMTKVVLGGVKGAREEGREASIQQRDLLLALLATNTEVTGQMAELISSASTSITSLHSTLNGKLQEMEGLCEGLQQHHMSLSAQVLQEVESHHASLLQHSEDTATSLQSLLNSQHTQTQSINHDLDSMVATLTAMKKKMSDLTSSSQQQVTSAQHSLSSVQAGAQETTGRLEMTLQRLGEKRCEVETALEQHIGQAQHSIEAATALQDQRVTELEEAVEKHVKTAEKEMKDGERSMKEALAKESNTLQEEAGKLDRVQEELLQRVQTVEEGLKELGYRGGQLTPSPE